MQKANRKSHLQPPPSPGTQALLRAAQATNPSASSASTRTPTSGDPTGGGAPSATATASTARTPDSVVGDLPPPGAPVPVAAAAGSAERPAFPPRTSSSGHGLPGARAKDRAPAVPQPPYAMAMPIRPAPPPGGPLPHPPGKEDMGQRRYPYAREGQPI